MALLYGGLFLWGSALFYLLFSPLYEAIVASGMGWPAWMDIPHDLVAMGATSLLGVMAAVTLIVQLRGHRVSAWVLFPALLLFGSLWWE
jgi:hypothetical protein